jgi:hypothetical protein
MTPGLWTVASRPYDTSVSEVEALPDLRGRRKDRATPAAARVLRADWDGVTPTTRPSPAAVHAFATSTRTRVRPAPAGALTTGTRRPLT